MRCRSLAGIKQKQQDVAITKTTTATTILNEKQKVFATLWGQALRVVNDIEELPQLFSASVLYVCVWKGLGAKRGESLGVWGIWVLELVTHKSFVSFRLPHTHANLNN